MEEIDAEPQLEDADNPRREMINNTFDAFGIEKE